MSSHFIKMIRVRENNLAAQLIMKNPDKISYLEADDLKVRLYTIDGSMVIIDTMLHLLEEHLSNERFFRCGWAFLINIEVVEDIWALPTPILVLKGGSIIPVPEWQVPKIKRLIEAYRLEKEEKELNITEYATVKSN